MCPGVEYGNAHISAAALFELLSDEVHNRGLASPPASFEANGLAARLVADKVGDGICESLMGATERVFRGGLIREQSCLAIFWMGHKTQLKVRLAK